MNQNSFPTGSYTGYAPPVERSLLADVDAFYLTSGAKMDMHGMCALFIYALLWDNPITLEIRFAADVIQLLSIELHET